MCRARESRVLLVFDHFFCSVFSDLDLSEVAGAEALPGAASVSAGMDMPKRNLIIQGSKPSRIPLCQMFSWWKWVQGDKFFYFTYFYFFNKEIETEIFTLFFTLKISIFFLRKYL